MEKQIKQELIKEIVQSLKEEFRQPEVFVLRQERGWGVELSSTKFNIKELAQIGRDILIKNSKPLSTGGYIN